MSYLILWFTRTTSEPKEVQRKPYTEDLVVGGLTNSYLSSGSTKLLLNSFRKKNSTNDKPKLLIRDDWWPGKSYLYFCNKELQSAQIRVIMLAKNSNNTDVLLDVAFFWHLKTKWLAEWSTEELSTNLCCLDSSRKLWIPWKMLERVCKLYFKQLVFNRWIKTKF